MQDNKSADQETPAAAHLTFTKLEKREQLVEFALLSSRQIICTLIARLHITSMLIVCTLFTFTVTTFIYTYRARLLFVKLYHGYLLLHVISVELISGCEISIHEISVHAINVRSINIRAISVLMITYITYFALIIHTIISWDMATYY